MSCIWSFFVFKVYDGRTSSWCARIYDDIVRGYTYDQSWFYIWQGDIANVEVFNAICAYIKTRMDVRDNLLAVLQTLLPKKRRYLKKALLRLAKEKLLV